MSQKESESDVYSTGFMGSLQKTWQNILLLTITVNLHNLSLPHTLEKNLMSLHKVNETFSVFSFS